MKAQAIRERIEKAEQTLTKKQGTLERHEKRLAKIQTEIIGKGWDLSKDRYQREGTPEHHDCYWTFCDLGDVEIAIKGVIDQIRKQKEIIAKYRRQLAEAEEKEGTLQRIPDVLKAWQKDVISMWDEYDMRKREKLAKQYEELGRREFYRLYSYSAYELIHMTDEEIHGENVKSSELLILNLLNRVSEIVGTVEDWSGLCVTMGNEYEGAVINGWVKGSTGTAEVRTIGAGGWNIQKFHYRTLVHRM